MSELEELRAAYAELSRENAGLQGELLGIQVSLGFFQNRCELLEAATTRKLNQRETDSFKGCCPLCALSPAEYWQEALRMEKQQTEHAFAKLEELQRQQDGEAHPYVVALRARLSQVEAERDALRAARNRVDEVLRRNGCHCYDGEPDGRDIEPCLAHRIDAAFKPAEPQ